MFVNRIQNTEPVLFKGNSKHNTYHHLKKSLYDTEVLLSDMSNLKENERYIGALPVEWTKSLKKDEIGEKTKQVYEILSDFADSASNIKTSMVLHPLDDGDDKYKKLHGKYKDYILEPKDVWLDEFMYLEENLSRILDKDCEVSYLSSGSYGLVFKIEMGDKTCALKTYSSDGYSKSADITGHGAVSEIANAVYLNKTLKPSQCSKFYCAKIPAEYEKDGFLLTNFEDGLKDGTLASRQRMEWFMQDRPYWGRITFYDAHDDNFSNGKLIDYGAVGYTFKDREALKLAKELFPLIMKGEEDKITEFKEKYKDSPGFDECMIKAGYFGGEIYSRRPAYFAEHCIEYKITPQMLRGFEALGIDYSKIKESNFALIKDNELREKLEELF